MAEFGWTVPVLVADDGEVIAGHARIMAATELGLTQAPAIVLSHPTEAQRRLINGERAILFATDPPYLVDYDGSNHPTRNKDWNESYGNAWDDSSQAPSSTMVGGRAMAR